MQRLSGMDDFFLHFERSGVPMHVGCLSIYAAPSTSREQPDFARIEASIRKGVLKTPVLRRRLLPAPFHVDRPYWVDAGPIDLERHVRHIALPGRGTWEQLRSEVSRLFSSPVDLERPPWEVTIIENLAGIEGVPPGAFASFTKVHHAVLDGVSGVEIMRVFHDDGDDEVASPPPDTDESDAGPSTFGLLVRAGLHELDRAVGVAGLASRSLQSFVNRLGRAPSVESGSSAPVPLTPFNRRPSASRVFGGCRIDLAELQVIRGAVSDATVNDVILAICGGALRRHLSERGELPKESLVAIAPISVRSEEPSAEGGTRISMMAVPLATDLADPLERLAAVCRATHTKKQGSNGGGRSTLLDVADAVPSLLGELAARAYRALDLSSQHPPIVNCVVSNVSGPREPLFLGGSRLLTIYGLGPILDGMGLIQPVLSYDGGITVTFTSCPTMLSNPEAYERCLRDAFDELASAAAALRDEAV